MKRTRQLAIGCSLLAMSPLTAQSSNLLQDASTQLHQAWLHEVLDLDVQAATRSYELMAKESTGSSPERWVAVARLAELQRLRSREPGALAAVATSEAPDKLRAAMSSAVSPPPIGELLVRIEVPAAELMQSLGQGQLQLPDLRPFTFVAQEWVQVQIDYRQIQRLQQTQRSSPRNEVARNARWYAADVLRVELQGNAAQAEMLRKMYFGAWKPPTWTDDAPTATARVRARIDAWIADPETSSQQRTLLRSLRESFDERAAIDPNAALTFLARLPVYCDRLLPEQPR